MDRRLSLGIDFGTNSVRVLLVDLNQGTEIASTAADYPSGEKGILLDRKNPHLARQYPGDYLVALPKAVKNCLQIASDMGYSPENIDGIGIDGTGSSPIPVDKTVAPLAFHETFRNNPNAQTWLWKDHTSAREAREISELASHMRPEYLAKCGGAYSSEWFFSKIFHCLKVDKDVFDAAYSWIELSDYIPAVLCGIRNIHQVKRNVCAAGHKAMYNQQWGGLPDEDFLGRLAPEMADMRMRLYSTAHTSDQTAGMLDGEWSDKLGLKAGIPVAVGALDAHLGAVGAGVGENILVKIMGTSTCDIMVYPDRKNLQDIPGVAGIVEGSVLPGYIGIEAGQSAVGDIFHWWVSRVLQKGEEYHTVLSNKASKLSAGQTGLLALDWNNGNRNILTDPNLTGLIIGQTLLTEDYEIYRTLIEATAFGARRIIEQMENHGIVISKVINCGGIAEKNPLVMQIYADILNRPMEVTASPQTVALGAAIFGGLVAYKNDPGFQSVQDIQKRVCRIKEKTYLPQKEEHQIYHRIYKLYKDVHDSFGISGTRKELFPLMKELLEIKRSV